MQRLDRLQSGSPGDCRSLGAGLLELRVDLWGGSKRTQAADIERARKWLDEARRRPGQ
jgi:putative component of toxin-antitoxin plasmid stabilization module